jgi:transposase
MLRLRKSLQKNCRVVEPLLPEEPPKPRGGRPRIDGRAALTGILFVLKSGIPWELHPICWGAARA